MYKTIEKIQDMLSRTKVKPVAVIKPMPMAVGDPRQTNSLATTSQSSATESISSSVPLSSPLPSTSSQSAATESIAISVALTSPLTATSSQSTSTESISTSVALPVMPEVIALGRPTRVEIEDITGLGRRETLPSSSWSISRLEKKLHKAALVLLSLFEEHDRRKRLLSDQPGSVPSTGFTNGNNEGLSTLTEEVQTLSNATESNVVAPNIIFDSNIVPQVETNLNTNPVLLRQPTPLNSQRPKSDKSRERRRKNVRGSNKRSSFEYEQRILDAIDAGHVTLRPCYQSFNSVFVPPWMTGCSGVRRRTSRIGNPKGFVKRSSALPAGSLSTLNGARAVGGSEGGWPKTIENYLTNFLADESSLTPSQARLSRNILTLCSRRIKRTISPSLIAVSAIYLAVAVTRPDNYFFYQHSQVEVLTLAIDIAKRLLYFVELNTKKPNISVVDFNGERLSTLGVKDVIDTCRVRLIHCKEEAKIKIRMRNNEDDKISVFNHLC